MNQREKQEYTLISLFRNTFRILMIDDEVQLCALARAIFERFPLLRLETAYSAREAEKKLAAQTYHLIFCDLGLNDLSGDQYYLVNKYGATKPLIILSGHASMSESAACMSAGALWVYDKPRVLDDTFFCQIIDRFLVRSLFLYAPGSVPHSRYAEAIDALIAHKPDSVEEWSRVLDINERYLRKICSHSPLTLYHLLQTFHLLDQAFACNNNHVACPPCSRPQRIQRNHSDCQKSIEFYCINKSTIDRFLRLKPEHLS